MMRVAVIGGTGYTALELIRILLRHPHAEVTAVTSRSDTSRVAECHTALAGRIDLRFENLTSEQLSKRADVVFTCLPHTASMEAIPTYLAEGLKVIDLSADYRLSDPGVYEQWYGHIHTDPTRLGSTVYGLPELYRDRIRGAALVANPGCHTSTAILGLAPLLRERLIAPEGICIDSKTGVSGAGRAAKITSLFSECDESVVAYGVGNHRHTPEIDQVLSDFSGQSVEVVFTPHLIPMDRGILASMYCRPVGNHSVEHLLGVLKEFYRHEPFVQVVDHLPRTRDVTGTNNCQITVRASRGVVQVFSVLDNLTKGASGAAVQNLNLICGFDERAGLVV